MNKSKKLTAAVAASAVASAMVAPAAFAATNLTDIDGSYAKDAIAALVEKGIINGKGDGKFDPTGKIERQDFAIILAKALGLKTDEAPATASFTDVPKDHYAFGYVEAAVKAGLIAGNGDGTFGAGNDLTRQDMAVLFARALKHATGYDVTGKASNLKFTDSADIADYAKDAVGAAVELGLIAGNPDNTFNPLGNAERQAVALVAHKFLNKAEELAGAALTAATVVDTKTLNLTFSKELDALTKEDVAVAVKADSKAVEVAEVTLGEDKKSATVKLSAALAAGTTYTVTVKGKTVEATTAAQLEVTSVKALNLKQVEVTFNTAPDATEAADESNYDLVDADENDVEIAKAKVDGNKVILSIKDRTIDGQPGAAENQATYKLTVSSNVLPEEKTSDVEFFDNTLPTFESASVIGNDTIKVKFSEPINAAAAADLAEGFKLNDGEFFVKKVTFLNDNTEANVEFYSTFEDGTYKLTATNKLEDYAGFNVTSKTVDVEVKVDAEAPKVEKVIDVTPTSATLVFNEDIEFNGLTIAGTDSDGNPYIDVDQDAPEFFHTNSKNPAKKATIVNGNELVLEFDEDVELPNGKAYIYVEEETVRDLWDNENEGRLSVAADVVVDNTAPKASEVDVDTQTSLIVTFDEKVSATAEDKTNYKLLDKDGKEVKGLVKSAKFSDSDHKEVTLTLGEAIYGDYKLVISGVEDVAGNELAEQTLSFNADDTTDPEFTDFDAVLYNADKDVQSLVISFDEKMATDGNYSVTDLAKYTIVNADGTKKSLASIKDYVKISAVDNGSKVKIELKASESALKGFKFAKDQVVQIGRVADAAGNYTVALASDASGSDAIVIKDGKDTSAVFVALDSAKLTATDTIVLTLDDVIVDFKDTDLEITKQVDGAPVAVTNFARANVTTVNGVSVITLKLAEDVATDGSGLSVKTKATGVSSKNRFGALLKVDATTISDKVAPELDVEGTGSNTWDNVHGFIAADGTQTVELTFSEDILASTVSKYSFEVENFDVTAAAVTGNKVTLTVSNSDGDKLATADHLLVTQKQAIYDLKDNAVSDIDTEIKDVTTVVAPPADTTAPVATVGATADATTLIINFGEAAATVVEAADTTTEGATVAFDAATDATHATVTVANTGALATETYSVTVTDAAGNDATYVFTFDGTTWTVA